MLDLPFVFMVLMGLAILAYVILDGFDLGVGILLPLASRQEQDMMVASIGPFWDANETWLVLGVGILLAAFPHAHGVILSSLYLPVALMLICLILRGVAFEFRVKASGWHQVMWNRLWRLVDRPARLADESAWTPRDGAVARWYSWLLLAGYGLLLIMVATVLVPTATRLTVQAVHELAIATSPLRVADVLAFLALNFWQPVVAAALAIWGLTRRRRRPRPTSAPV